MLKNNEGKEYCMIETLQVVLTDSTSRSNDAVKANLVNNTDSAYPWFD